MTLENHINKAGFIPFEVRCIDESMVSTDIHKEGVYTVLGFLQGYFILVNDKMKLGKYYRGRFKLVEYEQTPEEKKW